MKRKNAVLALSSMAVCLAAGTAAVRSPRVLAEATSWLNSGSNMYSNVTGNVGIGTVSPGTKLQINGSRGTDNQGQLLVIGNADHAYMQIQSTNPTTKEAGFQIVGMGNVTVPDWTIKEPANLRNLQINYAGSLNVLTILNNGNIGFGTSTPGTVSDYGSMLQVKGSTGSDEGHWSGRIVASGPTSAVVMGELLNTHKAVIGGHNSALTAWSDLIINPASGNVGIGATAPSAKMDIKQPENGQSALRISSGWPDGQYHLDLKPRSRLDNGASYIGYDFYTTNGQNQQLALTFGYGGKVGIGTTNPSGFLAVEGTETSGERDIVVGNDAFLTDINQANTVGVYGAQDSTQGVIRLGSGGAKIQGKSNGDVCIGACN